MSTEILNRTASENENNNSSTKRLESLQDIKAETLTESYQLYDQQQKWAGSKQLTSEQKAGLEFRYQESLARLEAIVATAEKDSQRLAAQLNQDLSQTEKFLGREELKKHLLSQTARFFDSRRDEFMTKAQDTQPLTDFIAASKKYFQSIQALEEAIADMAGINDADSIRRYQTEVKRLDSQRSVYHNNMLKALNTLNQTAKEVGATPFTYKNFLLEYRDPKTGQLSPRASNDRKLAAWYVYRVLDQARLARLPKNFEP